VTSWDRNGLRMPGRHVKRPKGYASALSVSSAATLPSVEQIYELVRRGDRAGLLDARDRLLATLGSGRSFTPEQATQAGKIKKLLEDALRAPALALADGPARDWGRPEDRPTSPLRRGEDLTLPARVASAKAALYPGQDADAQDKAREIKRSMLGTEDSAVREKAAAVKRAMEGGKP
jgi:hypothetical protein